jgi:hypothetical protein
MPEPVRAQQHGQRRAALRLPARVFHGRGRGPHVSQVDLVLHGLKAGVDVALDARGEQGEHRLVVAELRDLPEYHLVDILVYRRGPAAHRRRDARHQLGDRGTVHVHERILTHIAASSVHPPVSTGHAAGVHSQACARRTMPGPGFVTSDQWKNGPGCLGS